MNKLLVAVCMLSVAQTSQTMETGMKINKAVIPAAGLGTRFLPYTKSIPKEMLPILEKPSIQIIIEEGLGCGINDFIIIANDDKQALKNFLSHQPALESELAERGKLNLLEELNKNIDAAQFNFVPQPKALGLGHAILQTKHAVGDEYFGIFLPDEIMVGEIPALEQLIEVAQKYNASVIGVLEVPQDKVSSYGIVAIREQLEDGVFDVAELVEKPAVERAPSNLAIVGRYILSPRIFASLEKTKPGAGNEIQLTDGILDMMRNGERVIAYVMNTSRYDVGNPLGWLQANIDIGFKNPKIGPALKEYCAKLLATK